MEISCLICGDGLKIRRHNVFKTISDHSLTILYELIQKALGFELDSSVFETEAEKECMCLCESCFGKINNYDLGLTLCEKAQRELEMLLEEKIKKQEGSQPEDHVTRAIIQNAEEVHLETFEMGEEEEEEELVKDVKSENVEDEMEEEHLIEYDDEGLEQIEIQQSFESEEEIPQTNVEQEGEIKKRRPRSRKFTRNNEKGRFYCNICNAGYTTQEALDFHVEKHQNIPSNECPECHKKFAQKSALTRHMPMHTGKKSQFFIKFYKKIIILN